MPVLDVRAHSAYLIRMGNAHLSSLTYVECLHSWPGGHSIRLRDYICLSFASPVTHKMKDSRLPIGICMFSVPFPASQPILEATPGPSVRPTAAKSAAKPKPCLPDTSTPPPKQVAKRVREKRPESLPAEPSPNPAQKKVSRASHESELEELRKARCIKCCIQI